MLKIRIWREKMKKSLFEVIFIVFIFLSILITGCSTKRETVDQENNASDDFFADSSQQGTTQPQDDQGAVVKSKEDESFSSLEGFMFPNSDREKLNKADLANLSLEELGRVRNEIFARKGHIFQSDQYKKYFGKMEWYDPKKSISMEDLNDIEKYNVQFIQSLEEDLKPKEEESPTYIEVAINTSYEIDLDGDGKKDEVIVYTQGPDDGVIIQVNEVSYQSGQVYGFSAAETYAIVDLDQNDQYKEIIISDYGPSNDYSSNYLYYNGKNVIDMGNTGGLHNDGITIHGDGMVTAMFRLSVFQTWFGDEAYCLTENHQLSEIPQELYTTKYPLTTKVPIKLLTKADSDSQSFTVEANRSITLIATDNKEWILAKDENSREGWFRTDLTTLGVPADLYVMEIFDGVSLYD